ncbi:hypothetical protein EBU71_16300 [bacterium]|nr:hypothetical protein [Candidatus Elulimicrobium humile]
MTINNFVKAYKGDPDWIYTPKKYIGKQFKLLDANTIELEADQKQSLVLRQTPTESALLAKHIKLHLKENSDLDLVITNESTKINQQITIYDVVVESGSCLNLGMFIKNGKLNKHILQIYLNESSELNLYGCMINNTGGDTEIITKVAQPNPNSQSNQYVLGLSGNMGQTVYQSICVLDSEAFESEAHIESENLVIDNNSSCYSKPEIISRGYDHKTSYGTNINLIDPSVIYYLETRGFDLAEARKYIIDGFYRQVLCCVTNTSIQEEIRDFVKL